MQSDAFKAKIHFSHQFFSVYLKTTSLFAHKKIQTNPHKTKTSKLHSANTNYFKTRFDGDLESRYNFGKFRSRTDFENFYPQVMTSCPVASAEIFFLSHCYRSLRAQCQSMGIQITCNTFDISKENCQSNVLYQFSSCTLLLVTSVTAAPAEPVRTIFFLRPLQGGGLSRLIY